MKNLFRVIIAPAFITFGIFWMAQALLFHQQINTYIGSLLLIIGLGYSYSLLLKLQRKIERLEKTLEKK